MMTSAELSTVEVLVEGEWVCAHVRMQAGTPDHPMTIVHLVEPHGSDSLAVVSSDRLRPRRVAA